MVEVSRSFGDMKTYAAYAPRFKAPGYKTRNRLIKGKLGENEFMQRHESQLNVVLFGCGSVGAYSTNLC